MKGIIQSTIGLLVVGLFATSSLAHIYRFSNTTNDPIQVRVKLGGIGEPDYYVGGEGNIDDKDFGDPYKTKENDENFLPADRTHELRFVAFERKGGGAGDYTRKFMLCLAPATMQYRINSTGAWLPLHLDFVKPEFINDTVRAATALADGLKDTAADILKAVPNPKVAAIGAVAGAIPVGELIKSVSTLISYSMCRERDFYLVKTETGTIQALTLAQ